MQAVDTRQATRHEICPRPEWTRRFAYRAMLVQPELDTISAFAVAEAQYGGASDLVPEDAAELFTAQH